jgi:hypothetical protein
MSLNDYYFAMAKSKQDEKKVLLESNRESALETEQTEENGGF